MSIMFAALNPNISDAQLAELIKRDVESKSRVFDTFQECLSKMETQEDKAWYIKNCLPILTQFMFM